MTLEFDKSHFAAFRDFRPTLNELIAPFANARVLELGGGRKPSFALAEMPSNVASYTVNDIDPAELERADCQYDKACFDAIGDVTPFAGQYDVVFSRTLIEHVRDGKAMHRNVLRLLRPGGVAFHMAPTLYCAPFIINKYLPETLSRQLLYAASAKRRHNQNKFPAHYSWCFGNRDKMRKMLNQVGFQNVQIRSFYGHAYFDKVPGLRNLTRLVASYAARRDWCWLGSYAHIIAHKPADARL